MPDHQLRHLAQIREVAQLLVALQQHYQRQQMLRRARLASRPRHLGRAGGERLVQLARGDRALEPRIRGTFHRSHAPHDLGRSLIRSTRSRVDHRHHKHMTREEAPATPPRIIGRTHERVIRRWASELQITTADGLRHVSGVFRLASQYGTRLAPRHPEHAHPARPCHRPRPAPAPSRPRTNARPPHRDRREVAPPRGH